MPLTHTLAATGRYSKPLYLLSRLVAASATFQGMVSAANETAALGYVYWPFVDDTDNAYPPPRAIVSWWSWAIHEEARSNWSDMGSLSLSFEFPPNATYEGNTKDEFTYFGNVMSAILDEMAAKAGQDLPEGGGTYLTARKLMVHGADVEETENGDRFYRMLVEVEFR